MDAEKDCLSPFFRIAAILAAVSCAAAPNEFLAKNCATCHNAKLKTANLNLESLAAPSQDNREVRELIEKRIKFGEMPPKGLPRPSAAEIQSLTAWLEAEFEQADRNAQPGAGLVTARRLNRAEYNNTVHDLLGVTVDPADDFPQDDSGYGFDNIGDVLSLSPALLEKYLAAEKVAQEALLGPKPRKPAVVRLSTESGGRNDGPLVDFFRYMVRVGPAAAG